MCSAHLLDLDFDASFDVFGQPINMIIRPPSDRPQTTTSVAGEDTVNHMLVHAGHESVWCCAFGAVHEGPGRRGSRRARTAGRGSRQVERDHLDTATHKKWLVKITTDKFFPVQN